LFPFIDILLGHLLFDVRHFNTHPRDQDWTSGAWT